MIPSLSRNSLIRGIAAFLFFPISLVSVPAAPAQEKPAAKQLAVLRPTTQYCLVVHQSYEEAADASLPIDKITEESWPMRAGQSSLPAHRPAPQY